MLRAFFKALFAAIAEYLREQRIERDYQEALIENARRDEEAKQRAGAEATRKRMEDAEAAFGDDPAILSREWLRSRDPDTP
jgi:hypothetical protein